MLLRGQPRTDSSCQEPILRPAIPASPANFWGNFGRSSVVTKFLYQIRRAADCLVDFMLRMMMDSIIVDTDHAVDAADLPSCEGCRRRKLKCTRQRPLCSNCERLGVDCVYENRRNKPGLKSGAVESLNKRLEAVEKAVFEKQDERVHSRHKDRPPDESSSSRAGDQGSVLSILSTLAQEINNLNSTIAKSNQTQLGQSSNGQESPSLHPSRPIYDIGRPIKRKRDDESHQHNLNSLQQSAINSTAEIHGKDDSILLSVLDELVTAYFTRIHPWIPILHEGHFRRQLQSPDISRLNVILHAMLVAALRFVRPQGNTLSPDEIMAQVQRSRNLVLLTSMDSLAAEHLQALAILAFTHIGNEETEKAWPIIGSLARSVEYLQLSVENEGRQKRSSFIRPLPSLPQPNNWVEDEERRRIFWNIFILDRFCSITTGWNTSLTAADVSRRLPACGGHWYRETAVVTPYFGIWESSAARIGNSISFLPAHYPSPTQSAHADSQDHEGQKRSDPQESRSSTGDMSTVGAFAYYVESIESLSRINAYFLQQKIDFSDRKDVSSWLTRFKELDLRLVHWKMFLPQQWKDSGISRKEMPGVMDPNMTLAHTTHNTSMILLHQRIAYPEAELRGIRLPSAYSAETCQNAAIETADMVKKYLQSSPPDALVSPQMSFCCFVSGKVLLVHWRYYGEILPDEFWTIVDCLEIMSRRWAGNKPVEAHSGKTLFHQSAERLRGLHRRCEMDPGLQLAVLEYVDEADQTAEQHADVLERNAPEVRSDASEKMDENTLQTQAHSTSGDPPSVESVGDELSAISRALMDEGFTGMDRIMSYDDIIFNMRLEDFNAGSSDGWIIQGAEGLESIQPTLDDSAGSTWHPI